MSKHTPGPWQLLVARTMAHIHQNPRGGMIGSLPYKTDEEKADARLVAASPSMLEALKTLLLESDFDPTEPITVEQISRIAAAQGKAQAAIKLAEGE